MSKGSFLARGGFSDTDKGRFEYNASDLKALIQEVKEKQNKNRLSPKLLYRRVPGFPLSTWTKGQLSLSSFCRLI